jgi:hypothetical protein
MIDLLVFRAFVKEAGPATEMVDAAAHPGFAGTSDPELVSKLLKRHKDLDVKAHPSGDNAAYVGRSFRKAMRKPGKSLISIPRQGVTQSAVGGMLGAKTPDIVAHELGHREFGRTALGKVVQNPYVYSMAKSPLPIVGGLAAGAFEGRRKAKQKAKGEKASKIPYGAAVPLVGTAPMMASEAGASLKAMKMLRESGASPAQLRQARGSLGRAFATYAAAPVVGLGAYGLGKYLGRKAAPRQQATPTPE